MKKVELLSPAGDLERLKIAFIYGADAVYLGGPGYGLRASAKNFTMEEIKEGAELAHKMGKRVYVTVNIIPHNEDLEGLDLYLKDLQKTGVDALIVSDPGIMSLAKETIPTMELHLSTQANNTNYLSAKFWENQGYKRIVVARELSLEEITKIKTQLSEETEIEAFVHGAMCISYSGRCLISNFLTAHDANRGDCKQPCRWKYHLVEESRPGEYFPVYEDERGTFFFNSKDLCMIDSIPALINSGITSLKIEGRMKSAFYVATVTHAYRQAIDEYYNKGNEWTPNQEWLDELSKVTNREFTTGFYYGKPDSDSQRYTSSSYIRDYNFVGLVKSYDTETGLAYVEQRYRMFSGEEVEIIGPDLKKAIYTKIEKMWNEKDEIIDVAPHPKQLIKMKLNVPVKKDYIIRKKKEEISK